jgi:hypothetical protein
MMLGIDFHLTLMLQLPKGRIFFTGEWDLITTTQITGAMINLPAHHTPASRAWRKKFNNWGSASPEFMVD